MPPKKRSSESRDGSYSGSRSQSVKPKKPGPKPKPKTTKKNVNRLTSSLPKFILSEYEVNTRILCQHTDSFYYDAKIIGKTIDESGGYVYTIHYNGWNSRYDEELSQEEAEEKFLEFNPKNVSIAKQEISDARKRKASKSQKKDDAKKPRINETPQRDEKKSQTPVKTIRVQRSIAVSRARSNTLQSLSSEISIPSEPEKKESEQKQPEVVVPQTDPPLPPLEPTPLQFPLDLESVLNDDNDLINRQHKIPTAPARITIVELFKEYLEYSKFSEESPEQQSATLQLIEDLTLMFNKIVVSRLLYKFEIPQHRDLINEKRREFGLEELNAEPTIPIAASDDDYLSDAPQSSNDDKNDDSDEDFSFHPSKTARASLEESSGEKRQLRDTRARRTAEATPKPPKPSTSRKKAVKKAPAPKPIEPYEAVYSFADTYGYIHLVRFISFFSTVCRSKIVAKILLAKHEAFFQGIIKFLTENIEKYFVSHLDYEIAVPYYQRRAFVYQT